jgi:hypothetical protein
MKSDSPTRRIREAVERVDQSPMNPKRWCLTLVCGHEVWVNGNRRPTAKTAICERCTNYANGAEL